MTDYPIILLGCAAVAAIVAVELVRRRRMGGAESYFCMVPGVAATQVEFVQSKKPTYPNAVIITPGSQGQTGLKLRNLRDQYLDGGLTFKQMRRIQAGVFIFSPQRIVPPHEDNESLHTTEFDYPSDKIYCKAYWPRAIRNYPLAKLESMEDTQAVYATETLPDDTHTYELICFCYIDGKPVVGPNSIESCWWREEGRRGANEKDDLWSFSQAREWNLIGEPSEGVLGEASKVLQQAFSELTPGEHRVGFELCFRVLPLSETEESAFPSKPTPISMPISIGEFNLLVK